MLDKNKYHKEKHRSSVRG